MRYIPPEWGRVFGSLPSDPKPARLTKDSHYWVSDEQRHDLFQEAIKYKGGIYIGLGTDQNYLMAAWSRPEILVLFDFDQMVVDLHYAFRAIFLSSSTLQVFIERWSAKQQVETERLIRAAYQNRGPEFSKDVLRAFKKGRKPIHARLKRVKKLYQQLSVTTYLTDEKQYRFLVSLFETGRVFPVRGDLTAKTTMKAIASAVRKIGLTVQVLYLSNAEQYFKYTNDFKENMLALPFDNRSVVIRTAATGDSKTPDRMYEYIFQTGENFHSWLEHPRTRSVWRITGAASRDRRTGVSVVTHIPENVSIDN
ncbi:MAG: hypothetical protein QNJ97_11395 [Myxococcota bacterium]|nr:hypothetical protein [Myxococcota bacterium]